MINSLTKQIEGSVCSDFMSTEDLLRVAPEVKIILLVSQKSAGKSFSHMIKIVWVVDVWLCSVTAGWNYSLGVGDKSNNSPKVLIQAEK